MERVTSSPSGRDMEILRLISGGDAIVIYPMVRNDETLRDTLLERCAYATFKY